MKVEIIGAGFTNKGAQLMLLATLQELRNNIIDVDFVMEPNKYANFLQRARYGLYQKAPYRVKQILPVNLFVKLIPSYFRQQFGIVTCTEVDIAIDISGFAYSDVWNKRGRGIKVRRDLYKFYKKHGKKIILMPQAFGPFRSKDTIKSIQALIDDVDMVYARDKVSYEYLSTTLGSGRMDKVKLSPDFTNVIKAECPDYFNKHKNNVAIIPSFRVLEKNGGREKEIYINLLLKSIEILTTNQFKPFFLIFEGQEDYNLAKYLNEQSKMKLEIIREEDAVYAKGIIGTCRGVISSRFHALSCSLSQSIPSIAIGWSHKYQELLELYGVADCILNCDEDYETNLEKKLNIITDDELNKKYINIINENCKIVDKKITCMWNEVIDYCLR